MFWGNCLGIKPNTQHSWQTVYFPCFIFSTKHGAWTILSPNWCIPQPGLWYKCELCGTASWSHCQIPHSHYLLQHVCMLDVPGLTLITHHIQKRDCCLRISNLCSTDEYLINEFLPDHTVFILHASHSTSVLQSLMCFSQLSCFPLMWPKNDLWSEEQNGFSSGWWIALLFLA